MMMGLLLGMAAAATCAATDVRLPAPLASWTTPVAGSVVTPGRASRVTLSRGTKFAVPSAKNDPGTFGASLSFAVARAGTYEIALSEAAWIDVVRGGGAIKSTAHRHGPECSTVRKIVSFSLSPGSYGLRISGSKTPAATVIVYRVDA